MSQTSPLEKHDRLREYEADFTPIGTVRQGLKWLLSLDLAIPDAPRVLDPSAGQGVFAKVIRELFPNAHITSIEPRVEERHRLLACSDAVHSMKLEEWLCKGYGERESFDLVCTNPPFTHLHRFARTFAPGGGVSTRISMLLARGSAFQRGLAGSELIRELPPSHEGAISGSVKFRDGINPSTGRPYTSDTACYSWWVWSGSTSPSWQTYPLPMLSSSDRIYKGTP